MNQILIPLYVCISTVSLVCVEGCITASLDIAHLSFVSHFVPSALSRDSFVLSLALILRVVIVLRCFEVVRRPGVLFSLRGVCFPSFVEV